MPSLPLFVIRPAHCPACQLKGYSRSPDSKLFHAGVRESDMHVTEYTWSVPTGDEILPHHYDVWQCPKCLYADLTVNVENPERTIKDHHARIAWEQAGRKRRTAIAALRAHVPEVDMTPDGALALHASALFVANLPKREFTDDDRIARIALRMGWLLRERRGSVTPGKNLASTTDSLRECIELLDSQLTSTAAAIDSIRVAIHAHSANNINGEEDRSADNAVDMESVEGAERAEDPMLSLAASMDDKLREMRTLLTMLHSTVRHSSGDGEDATEPSETSGLGDLEEGLLAVRRFWPELPITEAQCLRMAVEHLLQAHEDEGRHRSIEDTLADLGLILDLLIRLGDHERALEFVTKIYNTGMEHKRELSRRVSEGKLKKRLSAHDEKMMARKIGIVHMAIQQAGERRQSILEGMHQANRYRINAVLKDTASFPLQARLEALAAAGIPEALITYLKARKLV